ncbi:MAG: DUF6435 family protein [Bacteroidota bacterium]
MFGLFKKKDPVKKMEKRYEALMEEAMHIQRSGDLRAYAAKIKEAEEAAKAAELAANPPVEEPTDPPAEPVQATDEAKSDE